VIVTAGAEQNLAQYTNQNSRPARIERRAENRWKIKRFQKLSPLNAKKRAAVAMRASPLDLLAVEKISGSVSDERNRELPKWKARSEQQPVASLAVLSARPFRGWEGPQMERR
jgi:hypothetical protein